MSMADVSLGVMAFHIRILSWAPLSARKINSHDQSRYFRVFSLRTAWTHGDTRAVPFKIDFNTDTTLVILVLKRYGRS